MWSLELIIKSGEASHKAICSKDKEILDVSIFNDEFTKKLIKAHNDELSAMYEKGMYEGIKIQKQVSKSL